MLDYMKHSLRGIRTGIAQTKPEFRKKKTVRQQLALPLADISLTTANMDMKLIQIDREHVAFQMTPRLPDLDNSSDLLCSII